MSRCRSCPPVPQELRAVAELLERRWLMSIVFAAMSGAIRFNEFAAAVDGISARMLSERLRDLEAAGLVERRVSPKAKPPIVEYRLTARGRALRPVVEALRDYATSIAAPSAPPRSPSELT